MFLAGFLAASFTFTATATGVEKGTAVEFLFAGKGTDRDYETMFVLDRSVEAFCADIEKAGLVRGKPVDNARSRLWPVGCRLEINPPISRYVAGKMPEGLPEGVPIYTGGTRLADGSCEANTNMPLSVFSIFTLAQSPIVYDGSYNQGAVYGAFTAKERLEKGTPITFTVTWDASSMPKALDLMAKPGKGTELISFLKGESSGRGLDVRLGFDESMTVKEATVLSTAISLIDSNRIKFNGSPNLFYRSFLPLVKWRDRKERLVQPFELMISGDSDSLVFIKEDWSGPGDDPVLQPVGIPFSSAKDYPRTDTCFIYADEGTTVHRLLSAIDKLKGSQVKYWYIFTSPGSI